MRIHATCGTSSALGAACRAAYACLRPGGVLALTVERWGVAAHDAGLGYRMERHGRYLHATDYVKRTPVGAGPPVEQILPEVLRTELGPDVAGPLVVASRVDE